MPFAPLEGWAGFGVESQYSACLQEFLNGGFRRIFLVDNLNGAVVEKTGQ